MKPENTALREAGTGRFLKGKSGNPGGRPTEDGIRELARQHGPKAIARLARAMDSKDERVSIAASIAILNRGYGTPIPSIGDGQGGGHVQLLAVMIAAARAHEAEEKHGEIIDAR